MEVTTAAGARALLLRDAARPLVAWNLRLATGSWHDPPGRSGMAHVLEHLTFVRTRRHGRGGHGAAIQARGGYVNAKTSADWTKYQYGITPDLLDLVLQWEIERFSDSIAMATGADLALEQDVVLNERRQRTEGAAYGDALEILVSHLFGPDSGYHRLPVGHPREVPVISLDEAREFHAKHYVAARVNLAIVGDFAPDAIAERVRDLLCVFGSGGSAPAVGGSGPVATHRITVETPLKPKIFAGYRLPPEGSREFELARLAAYALGRGSSSMLNRQLPEASSIAVKTMGRAHDSSIGVIELVPRDGVSADQALAALDRVIATGEPDLARAKAMYLAGRMSDDDSFMNRADGVSLAMQLGIAHGEHDRAVETATAEDLRHGIALWHQPGHRIEVVYAR